MVHCLGTPGTDGMGLEFEAGYRQANCGTSNPNKNCLTQIEFHLTVQPTPVFTQNI